WPNRTLFFYSTPLFGFYRPGLMVVQGTLAQGARFLDLRGELSRHTFSNPIREMLRKNNCSVYDSSELLSRRECRLFLGRILTDLNISFIVSDHSYSQMVHCRSRDVTLYIDDPAALNFQKLWLYGKDVPADEVQKQNIEMIKEFDFTSKIVQNWTTKKPPL